MSQSDEMRVARKYLRPRRPISGFALLLGGILGIALGLYYTSLNPVVQVNIAPHQLNAAGRADYIAAITLAYAHDSDLNRAVNRLIALRLPGDPIQIVAETACQLASSDYVNNTSGIRAVRSMMRFYQLQGRTSCADGLLPESAFQPTLVVEIQLPTPTTTLTPPASKTPTPPGAASATPPPQIIIAQPTSAIQTSFSLATINTFCGNGVVEVLVYDTNGATGLPGQPVRMRWATGENTFFTGLKTERPPGYADFQMDVGIEYRIDMPGRSDPVGQPLSAAPCSTESGARGLRSYRVVFRSLGR